MKKLYHSILCAQPFGFFLTFFSPREQKILFQKHDLMKAKKQVHTSTQGPRFVETRIK
jgi:hypothetical protein